MSGHTDQGHLKRKDINHFGGGFQNNNRDGCNIKQQAAMFDAVLTVLREEVFFAGFKGWGILGGLVYTVFLRQCLASHSGLEMEKLLTIGSPYNHRQEESQSYRVEMLDRLL